MSIEEIEEDNKPRGEMSNKVVDSGLDDTTSTASTAPRKVNVKATRLGREFKILDLKQSHENRGHLKYVHYP